MFWYVNREDLQLPNALLVCSPTPLERPLGAQSRYLIARPRIRIKFSDTIFIAYICFLDFVYLYRKYKFLQKL